MVKASHPRVEPDRWIERHGDALFRFALARVGDRDAAEDLVQETFVAALQGGAGFTQQSAERTWLIGILKHKLIDHLRQRYRRGELRRHDGDESDGGFFGESGAWKHPPAAWHGQPEEALERDEFWDVFRACAGKLPRSLADVFLLREVDGMSSEEVCQVLNLSPTNLWTRLHRARLLLRACLERHGIEGSNDKQ